MLNLLLFSLVFLVAVLLLVISVRAIVRRSARKNLSRGLFRFHDGVKIREIDPIGVLLSLEAHPQFRLDLDPKRAIQDGDQTAMSVMADAVRQAFGVPAFTQPGRPGLTVYECVELLAVFMVYVDLQKKSTKPTQTYAQPMESTSTDAGKMTTLGMSDSGSIAAEPLPSTL